MKANFNCVGCFRTTTVAVYLNREIMQVIFTRVKNWLYFIQYVCVCACVFGFDFEVLCEPAQPVPQNCPVLSPHLSCSGPNKDNCLL
jgi:hypothetical protein